MKKKKVKKAKKGQKEFEAWANAKMAEIQEVILLNDFTLNPIEPSHKEEVSYSLNHYPYKDITIQYSNSVLEHWLNGDKEASFGVLVHELIHPLTDPLYCKGTNRYSTMDELNDERESLTDHIANIIIKAKLIKP